MTAIRLRATVWFATGVAMTLLASIFVVNAWQASAAPSNAGCSNIVLPKPVRILDTRDVVSEPAGPNVGLNGPIVAGQSYKLQVTGSINQGNLPAATVIPTGATSIDFNVTVVRNTVQGFVSVRPGDATGIPGTSSENVPANSNGSNNFGAVGLPANGTIDLYYGSSAGAQTELIIDVVRYCATDSTATTTTTTEPGSTTTSTSSTSTTSTSTTSTSTTSTTTTTLPFDGSAVNIAASDFVIETVGDVPGKKSDSGTSSTFNKVRFSVTNGAVTGIPGDDGNASNGKTSNVDPGSTFDSNTIKVTIAGGFTDPAAPTSIGSRWDFKVKKYEGGIASGTFARTDIAGDTGIFQMCPGVNTCPTPLPTPTATIVAATDGPTPCTVPPVAELTYVVQFTGTTPGVAPPTDPPNSRFDVRWSAAGTGAITGQDHKYDADYYTRPSGNIVCGNRTMTVLRDNSPSFTSLDGTWTLFNIVAAGGGYTGNYSSDRSTGVTGVPDVGTFTMNPK